VLASQSVLARGRFTLLRALGGGGYGDVIAAYDRDLGTEVAIKRLRRVDGESLLGFRHEFRMLAALNHPNLVRLGELFEEDGEWFFSMELIHGSNFLEWVSASANDPGFAEKHLRKGLVQLVRGLNAVHSAGFLHRDIKPANVLVEDSGRVVLLDFGLAVPQHSPHVARDPRTVRGTPAYMAPEQARGEAPAPEADYYALGALLYEALTGELPFDGAGAQVLLRKQRELPAAPSKMASGIPVDLEHLCMRLMQIEPSNRPTGREILTSLGATERASTDPASRTASFVGRERELKRLRACFDRTRRGNSTFLLIEGEAGIGKTALVEQFVASMNRESYGLRVLQGRCYERELVSFKAFEGIAEGVAALVQALPLDACHSLLPPQSALLALQFPVFARIPELSTRVAAQGPIEPAELRVRVWNVFVELLARLAAQGPLILCVDDLHWADPDSLHLLDELARSVAALPILLIATTRPVGQLEGEQASLLRSVFRTGRGERLHLRGLHATEARRLAALLSAEPVTSERLDAVASGTEGHPMLIAEVVGAPALEGLSPQQAVHKAVDARTRRLSEGALRLVELIAVAGVPCNALLLRDAVDSFGSFTGLLHELRSAKLIRSNDNRIECAHDHVRTAVLGQLTSEQRIRRHITLARALESHGQGNAAQLADYWQRAEDPQRALPYLVQAASDAARALAFDRAVRLYTQAIRIGASVASAESICNLRIERGHAFAHAGRGAEAAADYLHAAQESLPVDAFELRRRAAHHLLRAGLIDDGVTLTNELLAEVGVKLSGTVPRAIATVVWHRTCLAARKLRSSIPPNGEDTTQRRTLQLLWSVAPALNTIDYLRGAELQAQYLRKALAAGDKAHLIQGLLMEAVYRAAVSTRGHEPLFMRCEQLMAETTNPYHHGLLAQCKGTVAFLGARYHEAAHFLNDAEATFKERCRDVSWELAYTRGNLLCSLTLLGEYAELNARSRGWLQEAEDRGNPFARMYVSTVGTGCLRHLLVDQPEAAEDEIDRCFASFAHLASTWALDAFQAAHIGELFGRALVRLYQGGQAAERFLATRWPQAIRAPIARGPGVRASLWQMRARAAISALPGASAQRQRELLQDVRASLGQLEKNPTTLARAFAADLRGQMAVAEGREAEALEHLQLALKTYTELRIASWGEPLRYLLGAVLGGDTGREQQRQAMQWATRQDFARPEYYLTSFAPALLLR